MPLLLRTRTQRVTLPSLMASAPSHAPQVSAAEALSVIDLRKDYGSKTAVGGISFHVQRGEIVGLLGPNGAGKTTTINMILSVLAPSSGRILIEGLDLATDRSRALERTNFAAVYAPLPGNLTVWQNLRIFAMI